MGGNYEKGMYNQLMEVMARLDTVEKESKKEAIRLNDEIYFPAALHRPERRKTCQCL